MNLHTLRRTVPAATAAALLVGAAAAPAASAPKITPTGAGGVKLGATYKELRAAGRVGRIRAGCEAGGPNTRGATLKAPLEGSVDFTQTSPRKVTNISIRGGAKARGVGVGGTIAQIKKAYPKAKVDHGTDETFAVTLVKIPKSGGGRLQFAVSTETHKVVLIGVPFVAFCE